MPQIGLLLLMTLIVAVATAALQLPLRHVLAVSALVATTSLALLEMRGDRFGVPLGDGWLRLLSGLWFAVVLAKIAAINLIGTQMRNALSASNARLALALKQVRELSERDELTGLHNRRNILTLLADERARFARGGAAFAVAIWTSTTSSGSTTSSATPWGHRAARVREDHGQQAAHHRPPGALWR